MNLKKTKKIITVFVLSLMVMLGTRNTVIHALPLPPSNPPIVIKKVLTLPDAGVKTPAETFTFVFEKHSINGDESKKDQLPAIQNQVATFENKMDQDADANTPGKQVVAMTKDTFDIKPPVSATPFPTLGVGQYTYRVTEQSGTTEGVSYSKASYLVSIIVQNDKTGSPKVTSVQVKKEKDDKGAVVENAAKTEYTPEEANNNLVFNNDYEKKPEITNQDKKIKDLS